MTSHKLTFETLSRQRPLILAGLIATGIVAAVQYKRMSIARNERAQRNEGGYYVSVDRSGGGI
ncbi:hypothetical protein RRF57_000015 [Xylaria bambusicola]|uniref:Uncharacterized protein n=1 Tax=Xylaria bambusicola TaxID=326684 RepID=A0AAN7UDL1_9PEZI